MSYIKPFLKNVALDIRVPVDPTPCTPPYITMDSLPHVRATILTLKVKPGDWNTCAILLRMAVSADLVRMVTVFAPADGRLFVTVRAEVFRPSGLGTVERILAECAFVRSEPFAAGE